MSNPAWTPRTVADGILRLAAGLMILGALGLGLLSAGSWAYTKTTAKPTHTFRLDQMTPIDYAKYGGVIQSPTASSPAR